MKVRCKRCDNREFRDVSSLRKHQWAAHRDIYTNVHSTEAKKARLKTYFENRGVEVANIERPIAETPANKVTGEQLLVRLKLQQTFINDVVSLLEGMMKE